MAVTSPQNSMIFSLSGPALDIAKSFETHRAILVYPFGRDNPGPCGPTPSLELAPAR